MDWLALYGQWFKAGHVIAVICWMAGIFYLPRLFVYHAERAEIGSQLAETLTVMERRLLKGIMNPAMIASWIFGILMLVNGNLDFSMVSTYVKLISVLLMTAFHMWCAARRKEFEAGKNTRAGRSYRIANEVPTVLLVAIVLAVVVFQ